MKNWLVFIACLFVLLACKNSTPPKEDIQPDTTNTIDSSSIAKEYFPVLDYIKSEIARVDSLQIGILKLTTRRGKTDSTYIKSDEFKKLSEEFITDELETDNFKKEFQESSFYDQTSKTPTFSYSTTNKNLEVQRVDVLIQTTEGYDKVNSIYMEKITKDADSPIIKKLYWKAGKSFQIITVNNNNPAEIIHTKLIWNYWE